MAPTKPLPADDNSEHEYLAIARRQADALNELDEKLERMDGILRDLIPQVQQIKFRVDAFEAAPPTVDYGDDQPRPARRRAPNPLCEECGCSMPSHFDHCSSYVPPRERVQ